MGFYSAIDCAEVHGSLTEDFSIEGGIQASVVLECDAGNKDALIDDLISNQREWPGLTGWVVRPRAFAATATPFSTNQPVVGQSYVWDTYRVAVKYSTDANRTLFSESIEPTAEFVRLDHRFFRWSSGVPLTEGEAPGVLRRELKLVRKNFNEFAVPTAVLTLPGAVNNAPYTSSMLGLTFNSETLLFAPEPVDRTVTTAGSSGYNYTLAFHFKPNGWNKYWRPQSQSWESIYLADGTEYKSYPPESFASLLT